MPHGDFRRGAAHEIHRADLAADCLDIEIAHCASLPSASASNARLPRRFHSASMSPASSPRPRPARSSRSEEHTSELQSLMRISYAVFCLKKKKNKTEKNT